MLMEKYFSLWDQKSENFFLKLPSSFMHSRKKKERRDDDDDAKTMCRGKLRFPLKIIESERVSEKESERKKSMRDHRHASIIVDLNFRMNNDAQQKKFYATRGERKALSLLMRVKSAGKIITCD